jgi:chromosome partitioning protein
MIVTAGGEKGGVGKTTLACHLAFMLRMQGRDPLLIDADPQQTASIYCAARDQSQMEPRIKSVQKTGRSLAHEIRDLAQTYTDLVIDTGGRDSVELRLATLVSELLVIPINPTAFNWWTLEKMDELVGEARLQNPKLRALVLLNNVQSNWTQTAAVVGAAIEKLKGSEFQNLELFDCYLIHRSIYGVNEEAGRTVFEPHARKGSLDPKAQVEISAVFKEIFGYEFANVGATAEA